MSTLTSAPAPNPTNGNAAERTTGVKCGNQASHAQTFTVGDLVSVASRTWPGINQPGGVGRVTSVVAHTGGDTAVVSVKYVVDGRHEKAVHVQYVQPHSLATNPLLRDRTMLLGRCARCGSLRADCGSCDVRWQDIVEPPSRSRGISRRAAPRRSSLEQSDDSDITTSRDVSDDSSVELENILKKHRLDYQKYKRLQAKAKQFFADANLGSSSSESDMNSTGRKEPKSWMRRAILAAKEGSSSSSDNNSSSDDGACLHELAFQSSQLVRTSFRKNARRRRMTQRASRNNFESNSSSSDKEAAPSAVKKKNFSPTCPSLSTFSSNPGSPDHARPGTLEVTAAAAASSQSPCYIYPTTTTTTRALASSNGGDDGDDCCGSDGGDDMKVVGDIRMEKFEEDFIQPEGNADNLPSDVRDDTSSLVYPKLEPFFEMTVSRLENNDIPAGKCRILELERQWQEYHHASADRQSLGQNLKRKRCVNVAVQSLAGRSCLHKHILPVDLQRSAARRAHSNFGSRWPGSMSNCLAEIVQQAAPQAIQEGPFGCKRSLCTLW